MKKYIVLGLMVLCAAVGQAWADGMRGDQAFLQGDYAVAYREWRRDADAGDSSAMAAVGTLYDTGHGVTQDFAMALSWYRRAAEAGDVSAMFNIGAMYDSGRGAGMDRLEAVRWYEMASEKGNGRAAYNLGVIFRDGDGVPRDKAKATRQFRRALDSGLEAARPNLVALGAAIAPQGAPRPRATPREAPQRDAGSDPATLLARLEKAALEGSQMEPASAKAMSDLLPSLVDRAAANDPMAMFDLGYAFERGLGGSASDVRAYVYYLRAAASATSSARVKSLALQGASNIGARLTADQHASARAMLIEGRQ